MKKKLEALAVLMIVFLFAGCVSTYWEQEKTLIPQENGTTNTLYSVHVGQKAFWVKSDISNLKIPYGGDHITLGGYSTKGDVEMTKAMGDIVIYAMASYASIGSIPAMEAILQAFNSGKAQEVICKVNAGIAVTKDDFVIAPVSEGKK